MESTSLIGERFGKLLVIGLAEKSGFHKRVLCKCDCGKTKSIRIAHLLSGNTRSCRCLMKQLVGERTRTHGFSTEKGKQTRLHRIWSSMKARCSVKTHQSYKNYGGRGVSVCGEWFYNYLAFHEWALSCGYNSQLTIDRIDNDGNYSPDNCRWISKRDNSRNTRRSKLFMKDISKIKKLISDGVSRKEIADMFSVSASHITNISTGHRWAKTN